MSRVAIPAALSRGAKGWDAVRLSKEYTQAELSAAIVQINEDPANANPEHAAGRSIYLLTKAARDRTAALAWAIFYRKQGKAA